MTQIDIKSQGQDLSLIAEMSPDGSALSTCHLIGV